MLKELKKKVTTVPVAVAEEPLIRFFYGVVHSGKTEKLLHDSIDTDEPTVYVLPKQSAKNVIEVHGRHLDNGDQWRITITPDIIYCDDGSRTKLFDLLYNNKTDRVVIDDCHFLSPDDVTDIANACWIAGIKLDAYGLLTSFRNEVFPGGWEWINQADEINCLERQCEFFGCFERASYNCLLKQPTPPKFNIFPDGDYIAFCPTHRSLFVEEGLIEQ